MSVSTATTQPSHNDDTVALREEVERLTHALRFYRSRCEALQVWQSRMRDPERTLVCDILANGNTLPDPSGTRYPPPTAEG